MASRNRATDKQHYIRNRFRFKMLLASRGMKLPASMVVDMLDILANQPEFSTRFGFRLATALVRRVVRKTIDAQPFTSEEKSSAV